MAKGKMNNQAIETRANENKLLVCGIEVLCDRIKKKAALINDDVDDELKVRRINELLWRVNGELSTLDRDLMYQDGSEG